MRLLPDDEPGEPREPREQPLRIDVRPVHTDLPLPINTEPAKPRRVYIRNSVGLARCGYTPGCIGCEVAMTLGPSRDHTEQCRTRIIRAMSSDADLSARVREAHERMSRSVSDAANKSNDPVLSRIAGWVPDEQFMEVAGLDGPPRCSVAYDCGDLQPRQVVWA